MAEDWVLRQLKRYEELGLGHLAVENKNTGEFLGMGGVIPREVAGRVEHEIAYSLIPKFWGFGFATEIANKMIHFGFENIPVHQFISIIDIDHTDSANVAIKNNMKLWKQTKYLDLSVNIFRIKKSK